MALILAGCGGGSSDTSGNDPRPLTFDYLGGGSKVIQVYPGVDDTAGDKKANGTFLDGQQALAECWTDGRPVDSVTSLGELPRHSDKWFKVDGPDETYYATAVYVEDPQKLLRQLPEC